MKYLQHVSIPPVVQKWLESELEELGIDSKIYARTVLSLLAAHSTRDPPEIIRSGYVLVGNKQCSTDGDFWTRDAMETRRADVMDCLRSASDDGSAVARLVSQLIGMLHQLHTAAESDTRQQLGAQPSLGNDTDPWQRYDAAFPPLELTPAPAAETPVSFSPAAAAVDVDWTVCLPTAAEGGGGDGGVVVSVPPSSNTHFRPISVQSGSTVASPPQVACHRPRYTRSDSGRLILAESPRHKYMELRRAPPLHHRDDSPFTLKFRLSGIEQCCQTGDEVESQHEQPPPEVPSAFARVKSALDECEQQPESRRRPLYMRAPRQPLYARCGPAPVASQQTPTASGFAELNQLSSGRIGHQLYTSGPTEYPPLRYQLAGHQPDTTEVTFCRPHQSGDISLALGDSFLAAGAAAVDAATEYNNCNQLRNLLESPEEDKQLIDLCFGASLDQLLLPHNDGDGGLDAGDDESWLSSALRLRSALWQCMEQSYRDTAEPPPPVDTSHRYPFSGHDAQSRWVSCSADRGVWADAAVGCYWLDADGGGVDGAGGDWWKSTQPAGHDGFPADDGKHGPFAVRRCDEDAGVEQLQEHGFWEWGALSAEDCVADEADCSLLKEIFDFLDLTADDDDDGLLESNLLSNDVDKLLDDGLDDPWSAWLPPADECRSVHLTLWSSDSVDQQWRHGRLADGDVPSLFSIWSADAGAPGVAAGADRPPLNAGAAIADLRALFDNGDQSSRVVNWEFIDENNVMNKVELSDWLAGVGCDLPDDQLSVSAWLLEEQWRQDAVADVTEAPCNNEQKNGSESKRPCSYFLVGSCKRKDCQFSHDVSKVTCIFWEEGDCFKGATCPFLHGYPDDAIFGNDLGKTSKKSVREHFEFIEQEFPSLNNNYRMSVKYDEIELKHSRRACRRHKSFSDAPPLTAEICPQTGPAPTRGKRRRHHSRSEGVRPQDLGARRP